MAALHPPHLLLHQTLIQGHYAVLVDRSQSCSGYVADLLVDVLLGSVPTTTEVKTTTPTQTDLQIPGHVSVPGPVRTLPVRSRVLAGHVGVPGRWARFVVRIGVIVGHVPSHVRLLGGGRAGGAQEMLIGHLGGGWMRWGILRWWREVQVSPTYVRGCLGGTAAHIRPGQVVRMEGDAVLLVMGGGGVGAVHTVALLTVVVWSVPHLP